MSNEAQQTPLLDLLRAVPADARAEYEHGQFHHSMIPYGRLCTDAAKAIAERDAEIARLRQVVESTQETSRLYGLAITAERQRANALLSQSRLPEYLVRRIKHAIQKLSHPVAANPWTADLLNDILGAVGVRHE